MLTVLGAWAAELDASSHGTPAALARAGADQLALELGQAGQTKTGRRFAAFRRPASSGPSSESTPFIETAKQGESVEMRISLMHGRRESRGMKPF
jgi:hypothetical protein